MAEKAKQKPRYEQAAREIKCVYGHTADQAHVCNPVCCSPHACPIHRSSHCPHTFCAQSCCTFAELNNVAEALQKRVHILEVEGRAVALERARLAASVRTREATALTTMKERDRLQGQRDRLEDTLAISAKTQLAIERTTKMEKDRLQVKTTSSAPASKREQQAALKLEKKAQKEAVKAAKKASNEEKKRAPPRRPAARSSTGKTDLL